VAVSVCLDDGHDADGVGELASEEGEVVAEGRAGDFRPAPALGGHGVRDVVGLAG
jgi:hypothetical protein